MLQCQKETLRWGKRRVSRLSTGYRGRGTPSYCRSRVLINWRMPSRCFSSERHQQKLLGEMIHFQERRGCGGIVPSGLHSCGGYGGTAHVSVESAGRNRRKSPILYGSWPGGGSDADATDHRDQNHFRGLVVSPGLLRHQYCHVRLDRRSSLCLFAQGEVPTRTVVLRPDRGDAGFRPNDQSRNPGAINAGDRRLAVAHFFGRLGRIRALSRRSVFLFGRCREPCADAQPLSDRKGLRSRSDRRCHRVHRSARASECDERAVSGLVGRRAHRSRRPRFRRFRNSAPCPNPRRLVSSYFATAEASS